MICSPWITVQDMLDCGCPSEASPDVLDLAMQTSSELLYALTARQYPGVCEATVRPCSNPANPYGFNWTTWSYPWIALRVGGDWLNLGPCGCNLANDCGCSPYPRIDFGRNDILSIVEVTIDGVVLDPADYRLDGGQYLVRTDGGKWPCCQNLAAALGEDGTWGVELTYGKTAPASLLHAAAELAAEYVKACTPGSNCALPKTTQSVVKQGVSIELFDPAALIADGTTGLMWVDLAIKAANPNGLASRSRVLTPQSPSHKWS